jgi:hypothetical protein
MGLFKLAVVGGAGYYAVNKYRQNRNKTQNTPQQVPQQQYRDQPYQPDYYNHNSFRGADDDMYGPQSEKRQYSDYNSSQRQLNERPLQLNFVAPSEKTMAQMSGANAISPLKY